jgi:regulator of replication initiation timing
MNNRKRKKLEDLKSQLEAIMNRLEKLKDDAEEVMDENIDDAILA